MRFKSEPAIRRYAPATERNRDPILEVLRQHLRPGDRVFEVASGTGQHAAYFAARLPDVAWQPSEADTGLLGSIEAWRELDRPLPPRRFDVTEDDWESLPKFNALVSINMIHIAPWESCVALLRGAERIVQKRGLLFLYGPFIVEGKPTAPSNLEFDRYLKSRDPRWGIRSREIVLEEARRHHFQLKTEVEMPANNLSLVLVRDSTGVD